MSPREYKCWLKLERLLKSMQSHGFVRQDQVGYYSHYVVGKINRLAAAGLWDDCLIAIQACEDEYHQEWLVHNLQERKAA